MPIELLAILSAAMSAVAHLAFKKAVGAGRPVSLLAVRWTTGAAGMLLALALTSGWGAYRPTWALVILIVGSVMGPVIGWLLYLRSLRQLDVSVAQPIFNSSMVVAMVLAVIFLGERPNAFTVIGAALILVGVQLLQQMGTGGSERSRSPSPVAGGAGAAQADAAPRAGQAWGVAGAGPLAGWLRPAVLPALAAAFFFGVSSFAFKVGVGDLTPVETNWVRTTVPSLVLLGMNLAGTLGSRVGGLATGRPVLTWRGVGLAMTAGIANDLIGWLARFAALKNGPLVVVEPLASTSPLFVALLGTWLLGERLGRRGWLGILVTVGGTLLLSGLGR